MSCSNSNQHNIKQDERIKIIDSLNTTLNKDTVEMNLKAHLLYVNKEYLEASQEYSELIKIDSLNGKYHYRKGYCLAQLSSYNEAIIYYQQASILNYDKFECFKSIGIIYYFMINDNKRAEEYFSKCLEIKPKDKEVEKYMAELTNNENLNL